MDAIVVRWIIMRMKTEWRVIGVEREKRAAN